MNKLQHLQFLGRLGNQGGKRITDTDAQTYIAAVETADGQVLELAVKYAIQNFIVGAKADGIWDAIKSSAILAGARTLSGALVPLKGTAPTNFNFVSGDYNRKTGLVGNGSTKYLNSNRNNNTDPQDNRHIAAFVSSAQSSGVGSYVGAGAFYTGDSNIVASVSGSNIVTRLANATATIYAGGHTATGLVGASRAASSSFVFRYSGQNNIASQASQTPSNTNYLVFARNAASPETFSNARIAFYSIGESLDLALLDARVTTLINSLASAIDGVTDSDARAYISAVEAADGEMLEFPVAQAIQAFIVGCKADGIWNAIKSSCILAGARTLNGALVPLKGTAPTNFNFVSGDYNRKTGLVGNGSTKYLNSNRANNADPRDNQHMSAYLTTTPTISASLIGAGITDTGATNVLPAATRSRAAAADAYTSAIGFIGLSRNNASTYVQRQTSQSNTITRTSENPLAVDILVFARTNVSNAATLYSDPRLSFYSIGESLDIAQLDTRVTQLITDLNNAIP